MNTESKTFKRFFCIALALIFIVLFLALLWFVKISVWPKLEQKLEQARQVNTAGISKDSVIVSDNYSVPEGFVKLHSFEGDVYVVNVNSIAMMKPLANGKAYIFVSYGVGQGSYDTEYSAFVTYESYEEIVSLIKTTKEIK